MIQRLGRYPGQPLRTIDHGPSGVDRYVESMASSVSVAQAPKPIQPRPRIAAVASDKPHTVARLGEWGVECSCGFTSGADIEREWRFHRASMGLTTREGD